MDSTTPILTLLPVDGFETKKDVLPPPATCPNVGTVLQEDDFKLLEVYETNMDVSTPPIASPNVAVLLEEDDLKLLDGYETQKDVLPPPASLETATPICTLLDGFDINVDASTPPARMETATPISVIVDDFETNKHVLQPPATCPNVTALLHKEDIKDASLSLPTAASGNSHIKEKQIRELKDLGYTTGLANALSDMKRSFPLRIWIVDNSGSMQNGDGYRFVETLDQHHVKIASCTRWAELQQCVKYHIQMSALLHAPTTFRLLNKPGALIGRQYLEVAHGSEDAIQQEAQDATSIIDRATPSGCTPLTEHIYEIQHSVRLIKEQLEQTGQRVSLIIATDGLPTNSQGVGGQVEQDKFVQALKSLEGLPIWIVVRLCTDEEKVVEFYESLDRHLELSIEVLDDFKSEAKGIHKHNPWLNYTLPLHRMREMGFHDRMFDMLDERPLVHEELRQFLSFLFGVENMDGMPDPAADWKSFMKQVKRLNEYEHPLWNPLEKKIMPWIDEKKLDKRYREHKCCIM